MFGYNKVYTTAAHIDRWKYGINRASHYGIKEILDKSCASENNRFPTNDGQRNFDLLYFLFNLLLSIVTPIIVVILPIMHVLALLYPIFRIIINLVVWIINTLVYAICKVVAFLSSKLKKSDCKKQTITPLPKENPFKRLTLPMMTYPDCEACNCKEVTLPDAESETLDDMNVVLANNNESNLADFVSIGAYEAPIECRNSTLPNGVQLDGSGSNTDICNSCYNGTSDDGAPENYNTVVFSGYDPDAEISGPGTNNLPQPSNRWYKSPISLQDPTPDNPRTRIPYHVTVPQAVNLMNQRERYFQNIDNGNGNIVPNTLPNRMQVEFTNNQFASNGVSDPPITATRNRYEDMPLIMVTDGQVNMDNGQLLSFVDPELVPDENVNNTGLTINQYGYQSIEGTMTHNSSNYVQVPNAVTYMKPDGNTQNIDIDFYSPVSGLSYNFKMGLEYHQVIGSVTIGEAIDIMTGYSSNQIYKTNSILWNYLIGKVNQILCYRRVSSWPVDIDTMSIQSLSWTEYFEQYKDLKIYFITKGVDPFAPRQKMKFNMSMLFGNTNYSITSTHVQTVFECDYFPNIPIGATNPTDIYAPETHYKNLGGLQFNNGGIGNSNSKLFHKSFLFTPPSIGTAYEDCTSQNFELPQTPNTTTGCTISANLPYVAGETIKFSLDDSNFIIGTVISYNSANGDISFEIVSSTSIPGT